MVYMGFMIIGITSLLFLVYFPMWGGMLFPAKPGVSEEDYYMAEYTAEEKAQGLHSASLKFAFESKSERGWAKEPAVGSNAPDIEAKAVRTAVV
jgi:NNP family nitrate/nitrite transporter-like MFS transporter